VNLKKFIIRSKDFIEFKRKNLARRIVTRAIRTGELVRSTTCTLCKEEAKVAAHHIDYGKPLAVLWLCNACHGKAHRKKHPLNPINNKQTPNDLLWDQSDSVQVAFHIPVKNFIALKKFSEEEGIPISKIIRGNILKEFPVDDQQLEFNFEVKNDHTQQIKHERIQDMVENKAVLLRQEILRLQENWSIGNKNVSGVDDISGLLSSYGGSSNRLQCTSPN
jgi:hypothetical protein